MPILCAETGGKGGTRSSKFGFEVPGTSNFGLWTSAPPAPPLSRFTFHDSRFTVCPADNDLSSVLDSLPAMATSPQHSAGKLSRKPSLFLAGCGKTILACENFDGRRRGLTEKHPGRMLKKAVQQGRSERRGESYFVPYVEPLSEVKTKLADFFSILLVLLCLVGTACGITAQTGKIILDDPRGTVSLQTISDRSIQANHPINLEPALLAQLLKGIEIQDQDLGHNHVAGLQSMIAGPYASVPVFSDDQISFLAPLLAEGLRTAAADQSVAYRVVTTHEGSNKFQSPTTETTAGSLYAHGRQLYVTLSQYRYNQMVTNLKLRDSFGRENTVDYSGLQDRILVFTPKAAQRVDKFDPPTGDKFTDRFVAVDYQLLQQAWRNLEAKRQAAPQVGGEALEAAHTAEAQARNTAETQARATEAQARNTEALAQEVEALRKQLESVQKRLDSQPTGQDSPKQKTTPSSKPQQTAP